MGQQPDPADPDSGRRPITRAQLTLQGLRKLPRVVWLLGLAIVVAPALRVAFAILLPEHLSAPYQLTACRADARP